MLSERGRTDGGSFEVSTLKWNLSTSMCRLAKLEKPDTQQTTEHLGALTLKTKSSQLRLSFYRFDGIRRASGRRSGGRLRAMLATSEASSSQATVPP